MTAAPIPFEWTGDSFVPCPGFARRCDAEFVVGRRYRLVEHEERSQATHAHYFACLNTAWQNLPEHLVERLPTPEHLRKYALIKAGIADCRTVVCSSKAEAARMAAFVRGLPDAGYAVVTTDGATVSVWTARSQSVRAMGKRDFAASKEAVLTVIADLIGTTPAALAANAGQAA